MLKRSISSTLAKTTETLSALAKMISHKDSRVDAGRTFEIVEPLGQIVGIENDSGHSDRPSQWAAPDFVDAGDPSMAVGERLALEVEMGRDQRGAAAGRAFSSRSSRPLLRESPYSFDRLSQPQPRTKMRKHKCRWKGRRSPAVARAGTGRARLGCNQGENSA